MTQLKLLSFNVLTLEINALYYMIKIYSAQTKKIIRQSDQWFMYIPNGANPQKALII